MAKLSAKLLERVTDRKSLYAFLRDQLGWPLQESGHIPTFKLGKVGDINIRQLLPFQDDDPFIVLLVETENAIRREELRKVLSYVRRQMRDSALYKDKKISDILMIACGDQYRQVQFVRFVERGSRQPKLSAFGWDRDTIAKRANNTLFDHNIPALALTTVDDDTIDWAASRWSTAWDVEKLTKAFYKEFDTLRKPFFESLPNALSDEDRNWLCSLILNRLMFCWFLADQGIIPKLKDPAHVPDWYRQHFLPLCIFGLGKPIQDRGPLASAQEKIPYLNGGLFEIHSIEKALGISEQTIVDSSAPNLLPNEMAQTWFEFLGKWRWTLDEAGEDASATISPHVLGYIFERYINQKQMGAYYTKEDITEYICRSTIVPRLFDMLAEAEGKFRQSVQPLPISFISGHDGIRRYIFPTVKQPSKLPTETDYELSARQERVKCIENAYSSGEIQTVDNFVTLNLNLRLLAEDWVARNQDPEVLWRFYEGLKSITVLDPTVGSGAFLLAALEILAPLYEVVLQRFERIVKEAGDDFPVLNWAGELHFDVIIGQGVLAETEVSPVVAKMKDELHRVIDEHTNPAYFIRKQIVLNNLFGVDIMPEAVEICKLRLYLSLMAVSDKNPEPLPDLDFNICAGNTLVGYTSFGNIEKTWQTTMEGKFHTTADVGRLKKDCDEFQRGLASWRIAQLAGFTPAKRPILEAREKVRELFHADLFALYEKSNVLPDIVTIHANNRKTQRQMKFDEWTPRFTPCHWPVEFPFTAAAGGFDVIVGNPPYVETAKVVADTPFLALETLSCGNLYAHVLERSLQIANPHCYISMIVQLPIACSPRMAPALELMRKNSEQSRFAFFDDRPAKLFEGLEHIRATIVTLKRGQSSNRTFSTQYRKWYSEYRDALMDSISYVDSTADVEPGFVPKDGHPLAQSIRAKLMTQPKLAQYLKPLGHAVHYHNAPQYWMRFMDFVPYFYNDRRGESQSLQVKTIRVRSNDQVPVLATLLNSSLFYWWFLTLSDCRHLNLGDIERFHCDLEALTFSHGPVLAEIHSRLMHSFKSNAIRKETEYKTTGRVAYDEFSPSKSFAIIAEIDPILAKHFGLSNEELAFIQNYDIKYRLGKDGIE